MRNRADLNQLEIVEGLRKVGCDILVLSQVGGGCPDLLSVSKDGTNVLLEVKSPGGKVKANQQEFMDRWRGVVYVIKSLNEALEMLGYIEKGE